MRRILLTLCALTLAACGKNPEFAMGLMWSETDPEKDLPYATDVIVPDVLAQEEIEKRIALTAANDKIGEIRVEIVSPPIAYKFYELPPDRQMQFKGMTNFGYTWIGPYEREPRKWANTQLWVKTSALAAGKTVCEATQEFSFLIFYLSDKPCDEESFNVQDETIPKLGLLYSEHYDILLMSHTSEDLPSINGEE